MWVVSAEHLVRRVDLGLVLDQQPHNRLAAVKGSRDEARVPRLPGTHEATAGERPAVRVRAWQVGWGGRRQGPQARESDEARDRRLPWVAAGTGLGAVARRSGGVGSEI